MGACLNLKQVPKTIIQKPSSEQLFKTVQLNNLTMECPIFSLDGEFCLGYCVKAYDGDTCTININTKIGIHQWKVRLNNFDAPEFKTHNIEEKKHAIVCRDILLELIHNKYCIVKCDKWEKYGRLLGTIFIRTIKNNDKEIQTESCDEKDIKVVKALYNDDNDNNNNNNNNNNNKKYPQCPEYLINVNDWMLKYTPCVLYGGGKKSIIEYDLSKYHPHYVAYYNLPTTIIKKK
jgi:endonuclease YncB( thermonuclease family)